MPKPNAGLVVVIGLLAVVGIWIMALIRSDTDAGRMAASAISVIGTIVGTYFGHHAGSKGKERVEHARRKHELEVDELTKRLQTARIDIEEPLAAASRRFAEEFG